MIDILVGLFASALLAGGVLAFAALGECVGQRAGVFNLGIEGFMAVGGIASIAAVFASGALWTGIIAALAVGLVMGLAFGVTTVIFKVNQVISGLGFTFVGTGLAYWAGSTYSGRPAAASYDTFPIPGLSNLPFLGEVLFNHPIPVYLAFFVFPILLHITLFRSRFGLNLRAIGENPGAADAAGIAVVRIRLGAVVFGCVMASLSGAYLTLVFVPAWSEGITAGRGWISLAIVIFAAFRPIRVALASFFFGLVTALGFSAQTWGWSIPSAILGSLPYLATLIIMIIPIWLSFGGRRTRSPAALGLPYYREER